MLRAPICSTSATSSSGSRSRASITSVTIGSPVSGLGLGQQPQPLLAQSLEGVGRGARLVGAAPEHRGAGRVRRPSRPAAPARGTRPCRGRRSARSAGRRTGIPRSPSRRRPSLVPAPSQSSSHRPFARFQTLKNHRDRPLAEPLARLIEALDLRVVRLSGRRGTGGCGRAPS